MILEKPNLIPLMIKMMILLMETHFYDHCFDHFHCQNEDVETFLQCLYWARARTVLELYWVELWTSVPLATNKMIQSSIQCLCHQLFINLEGLLEVRCLSPAVIVGPNRTIIQINVNVFGITILRHIKHRKFYFGAPILHTLILQRR